MLRAYLWSNKYQFHSLWFDPIGARTHDNTALESSTLTNHYITDANGLLLLYGGVVLKNGNIYCLPCLIVLKSTINGPYQVNTNEKKKAKTLYRDERTHWEKNEETPIRCPDSFVSSHLYQDCPNLFPSNLLEICWSEKEFHLWL